MGIYSCIICDIVVGLQAQVHAEGARACARARARAVERRRVRHVSFPPRPVVCLPYRAV